MRTIESVAWRALLSVSLLLGAAAASEAGDAGGPAAVTCRVSSAQGERTYELRRATAGSQPSWTLAMRGHGNEVVLPLPGAEPKIEAGAARLSYRSANGGRLVDLDVSDRGATLSVWVDHGLEVNVDPDLDPRVDEMTIDKTAARCEVARPQ
jgi:hypothetical protein